MRSATRKLHRYLTVAVDHDTRRLIWAAPGRDNATLNMFFDELGPARCAAITHVCRPTRQTWIAEVVAGPCPAAVQCADPFHSDLRIMPMWSQKCFRGNAFALVKSA
jgi:transposase